MRITGVFRSMASLHLSGGRRRADAAFGGRARQRGIALAVALFLLILITLIGLVAIRGTTVQQRMTANFYDRQLAFQNAEAALRAGQAKLAAGITADDYRACDGSSGTPCPANPFTDDTLDASLITDVEAGTDAGQYTAGDTAPGQPQYVIELMCTTCTTASDPAECQSANCQSYGTQTGESSAWYYRITARSGNPGDADVANRAIVTLQAMFAVPPSS
jgi:type IV pilus assembly protein PilX